MPMSDSVMLSWTLPNWIAVVLMAALGYLVVAIVAQFVLTQFGGGSNQAS
jgi:hypothetical protein